MSGYTPPKQFEIYEDELVAFKEFIASGGNLQDFCRHLDEVYNNHANDVGNSYADNAQGKKLALMGFIVRLMEL